MVQQRAKQVQTHTNTHTNTHAHRHTQTLADTPFAATYQVFSQVEMEALKKNIGDHEKKVDGTHAHALIQTHTNTRTQVRDTAEKWLQTARGVLAAQTAHKHCLATAVRG